jgi:hypothetical protein
MIQEGISVDDAAFLISVIGISNTLGRVIFGWLSDFPWVSKFWFDVIDFIMIIIK